MFRRPPFRRPPLPKEHGSWVMFFIAYLAGTIAAGGWGLAPALFLLAALSVFIIRRPLAMLLRREWKETAEGAAAVQWAIIFVIIIPAAGLPLLFVYRLTWLIWIGLGAAALLSIDLFRSTRTARQTFWSELAGALGLPLVGLGAYYSATGGFGQTAFALWLILTFQFASDVIFMDMKLRWVKTAPVNRRVRWETGWRNILFQSAMLLTVVALSAGGYLPRWGWAPLAPTAARRLWAVAFGRRDTNFRRMGREETALAVPFLILLVLTVRGG